MAFDRNSVLPPAERLGETDGGGAEAGPVGAPRPAGQHSLELGGAGGNGRLSLNDCAGSSELELDGSNSRLRVGGRSGKGGILELRANNLPTLVFDAAAACVEVGGVAATNGALNLRGSGYSLLASHQGLRLQRRGADGRQQEWAELSSATGRLALGGGGMAGMVELRDGQFGTTCSLDGGNAQLSLGGKAGKPGRIELRSEGAAVGVRVDGGDGALELARQDYRFRSSASGFAGYRPVQVGNGRWVMLDGRTGAFSLGGAGVKGSITLSGDSDGAMMQFTAGDGRLRTSRHHYAMETMPTGFSAFRAHQGSCVGWASLDGVTGDLSIGGSGVDGTITLRDTHFTPAVCLDAANASLHLGRGGFRMNLAPTGVTAYRPHQNGSFSWLDLDPKTGEARLGGGGVDGTLNVCRADGEPSIRVDGASGEVRLLNADCAEEFDLGDVPPHDAVPGTVLVIGDDGRLVPCSLPYDTRVAGIISGAGSYRPGIVLDRQPALEGRQRRAIALVGKVYCRACTFAGPIRIGDLLTTSEVSGTAMRVADRSRASGAIVGKALSALDEGEGMVAVLVSLQ